MRVDRVRRAGPSTCAGAVTGAATFFRCTGAVAGAFFRRFVASSKALAGVASSSGLYGVVAVAVVRRRRVRTIFLWLSCGVYAVAARGYWG